MLDSSAHHFGFSVSYFLYEESYIFAKIPGCCKSLFVIYYITYISTDSNIPICGPWNEEPKDLKPVCKLCKGEVFTSAPSYHQRLTFAGVARGAVPGSVVNGITYRGPGDDRPYFDMSGIDIPSFESNEPWLPHNTAYLAALTALERTRRGGNAR